MQPLRTSTLFPDDAERFTLFVRTAELLAAEQRFARYDQPLASQLAAAGSRAVVRGFSVPELVDGIALEITDAGEVEFSVLVRFLIDQHVSPTSGIEMETDMATLTMTLGQVMPWV